MNVWQRFRPSFLWGSLAGSVGVLATELPRAVSLAHVLYILASALIFGAVLTLLPSALVLVAARHRPNGGARPAAIVAATWGLLCSFALVYGALRAGAL